MREEEYLRHKFTEDGLSPRLMPGTVGAIVRTSANEHDEHGFTTDDPELTTKMADKRFKKLDALAKYLEKYETTKLYGPHEADVTILGWGSTKGPIREAVASVSSILKSAKTTVVVENNKTSQLSSLMREHLLIDIDHKILKYDGRPFNPRELSQTIMDVI